LKQKRIYEATNQYNRIILLAPNSDAARLSQKGLSLIGQAFSEDPSIKTISYNELTRYKDNYLDYVLTGGQLTRWHTFPLKVYIQPGTGKDIALLALGEWQKKTAGLIKFEYTETPLNAQITVDFRNKLEGTSTKEAFIAGYSKPYYQGDDIIKSEINILAVDPATGKDMEANRLYHTIIHEVGHSLGLNGHSPNKNDAMYYSGSDSKELSQRDLNTIALLYKTDKKTFANRAKSGSDVELQQALDYVKTVPDKSVGWAKLGDYYSNKKMYAEAIKNYKKAVSLEPSNAQLHALLGVAYSSAGDSKNAFTSSKTACDLDKTNEIYLTKFCTICANTGQKALGQEYLDAFIKANPQANASNNIKQLKHYYK
jgi:tetratricopeptide (TPR) repeat protein